MLTIWKRKKCYRALNSAKDSALCLYLIAEEESHRLVTTRTTQNYNMLSL